MISKENRTLIINRLRQTQPIVNIFGESIVGRSTKSVIIPVDTNNDDDDDSTKTYKTIYFPDSLVDSRGIVDGFKLLVWLLSNTIAYIPERLRSAEVRTQLVRLPPSPLYSQETYSYTIDAPVLWPEMKRWTLEFGTFPYQGSSIRISIEAPKKLPRIHPYFAVMPRPHQHQYLLDTALKQKQWRFSLKPGFVANFQGFRDIKAPVLKLVNDCWGVNKKINRFDNLPLTMQLEDPVAGIQGVLPLTPPHPAPDPPLVLTPPPLVLTPPAPDPPLVLTPPAPDPPLVLTPPTPTIEDDIPDLPYFTQPIPRFPSIPHPTSSPPTPTLTPSPHSPPFPPTPTSFPQSLPPPASALPPYYSLFYPPPSSPPPPSSSSSSPSSSSSSFSPSDYFSSELRDDNDDDGSGQQSIGDDIVVTLRCDSKLSTRAFSAARYNIVLRDITYLDVPNPSKRHKKYAFVGAYYPHAYGLQLGYIIYSKKDDMIIECVSHEDQALTLLLVNDVKTCIRESSSSSSTKTSLTVNPSAKAFDYLESLLTSTSIGNPFAKQSPESAIFDYLLYNQSSSSSSSSSSPIQPKVTFDTGPKEYQLIIEFTLDYRPILAGSPHEIPHGVFVYLSRGYTNSEPVFISADDAIPSKKHKLVFSVTKPYLPGHALINFDTYALFKNEVNEVCTNQCGYTNLRLADIADAIGSPTILTLRVPTSKVRRSKGTLAVICHSISLPIQPDRSRQVTTAQAQEVFTNSQKYIDAYIRKNQQFYRDHPPSAESIKNVTVFLFSGRKGRMIGALFDNFHLPKSNEKYYLNALLIAYRRRYPFTPTPMKMEQFLGSTGGFLSLDEQARLLLVLDMLCIYVNYISYLTDIVDNNDSSSSGSVYSEEKLELMESFDMVRPRDSGDCEDDTKEILIEVMEIRHNRTLFQTEVMLEVRRLLNMFIFVSALCGVSKAAMSRGDASARLNGHECALAIPNYIFFKALSRSDPNHPLLTFYSKEEQMRGQSQQIYVLEGTGNLYPEPRERPASHKALAKLFESHLPAAIVESSGREFFYHPNHPDNFYKKIITLMTPGFFLEKGYTGFEFLVCIEDTVKKGVFLRGVDFVDLLNIDRNPSIRIFEAPKIDPTTFRASTRVNDDDFPPTELEPINETTEMQQIAKELTISRTEKAPSEWYSMQIRFANMTPTVVKNLKDAINVLQLNSKVIIEPVKLNRSLQKFIGGYTIIIY